MCGRASINLNFGIKLLPPVVVHTNIVFSRYLASSVIVEELEKSRQEASARAGKSQRYTHILLMDEVVVMLRVYKCPEVSRFALCFVF